MNGWAWPSAQPNSAKREKREWAKEQRATDFGIAFGTNHHQVIEIMVPPPRIELGTQLITNES